MVQIHQTVILLLILQIYVGAAPSSTAKPDDPSKAEEGTLKLDDIPSPIEESKDGKSPDNQRQKRFYSHYGYGFPPINPVQYPTYNKRDQSSDLGLYGVDDPLSQIHRRLQEIASFARQPAPPPPPPLPTQFPFFFPVIFVPQHCACAPSSNTPNTPTSKPDTTQPATKPPVDSGTTTPDVLNRWPEMEDERQNWGLVINETDYEIDDDFTRPISFDPIVANTSMSRPAPPVEHGSNQGGSGGTTTTARPFNDEPRPPKAPRPPATVGSSFASSAFPSNSVENPREAPSTCDGAVLSCCHQPQVTYDCFALLGCPDPTSYGNPCDPSVILNVINKYQQFYGVRTG